MAATESNDALLALVAGHGIVAEDQIQEIGEEHERSGKPVRSILLDMDIINEDQLLDLIAEDRGSEVVNLLATDIPPDVIHGLPASVARMYNVVPVEMHPTSVVLAVPSLVDPQTSDELMFVLTRDVRFVYAREEDVRTCINQFYGDDSDFVSDMLSSLESEIEEVSETVDGGDDMDERGVEEAAGSAPVIRFVNLVLYQAVNDRASDIHFEPFEKEFKIRYRVDGALYEMAPPPKRLAMPVISRVKVMAGMNIAERRLPQDGRISLSLGGRMIDMRVSALPTQFGESVVLRVLDRSVLSLELENIGMPEDVYDAYTADIKQPNGIIIVTGPTGSGKTTTLYSALRRVNTQEIKILTAEEPVEYDVDGIIQVEVKSAVGNTFANVLRAFLRQDPDVMMVGEIRDIETAQIAIQASLTGHLVFSTLHTNDAAGAITRLIDMGVEPYLLSSTLEAVLGQRLVRVICDRCKATYMPDDEVLDRLDLKEEDIGGRPFSHGPGCPYCSNTGYHGRTGIYEYLGISLPIKALINERQPTLVIRNKAIELGMRTLRQDGVRNILDGYTTVDEIQRYT